MFVGAFPSTHRNPELFRIVHEHGQTRAEFTRKDFSLIFSALEVWHARLKTSPQVLFTAIYVYMKKREQPYLMLRPNELANQTKVSEARIYLSFSSFRSCAALCAWKIIKRQCKDIDETTFEFFPRLFLMLKVSSINYLFFFRK